MSEYVPTISIGVSVHHAAVGTTHEGSRPSHVWIDIQGQEGRGGTFVTLHFDGYDALESFAADMIASAAACRELFASA